VPTRPGPRAGGSSRQTETARPARKPGPGPHRQAARPWLQLLDDEVEPLVLDSHEFDRVVWSTLWLKRPDARLQFDLADTDGGTDLRWTLYADAPVPDPALTGHMRKRVNEIINANLRYTYGQ